jgi:hypothetical protein
MSLKQPSPGMVPVATQRWSTKQYMVKFCLSRTGECRWSADLATDPLQRQSWLEIEGRWLCLARSCDNERRPSGAARWKIGWLMVH